MKKKKRKPKLVKLKERTKSGLRRQSCCCRLPAQGAVERATEPSRRTHGMEDMRTPQRCSGAHRGEGLQADSAVARAVYGAIPGRDCVDAGRARDEGVGVDRLKQGVTWGQGVGGRDVQSVAGIEGGEREWMMRGPTSRGSVPQQRRGRRRSRQRIRRRRRRSRAGQRRLRGWCRQVGGRWWQCEQKYNKAHYTHIDYQHPRYTPPPRARPGRAAFWRYWWWWWRRRRRSVLGGGCRFRGRVACYARRGDKVVIALEHGRGGDARDDNERGAVETAARCKPRWTKTRHWYQITRSNQERTDHHQKKKQRSLLKIKGTDRMNWRGRGRAKKGVLKVFFFVRTKKKDNEMVGGCVA